jgi:hypothetical protein
MRIAEVELGQIAVPVLFAAMLIGALHAGLENGEEAFTPRYSSNRYPRAAPVGIDARDGLFLGL